MREDNELLVAVDLRLSLSPNPERDMLKRSFDNQMTNVAIRNRSQRVQCCTGRREREHVDEVMRGLSDDSEKAQVD